MPERPQIEQLLEHRDFLRALAGSLVSDPGTQEDLVSDAMEEAVLRPPRHGALRPWLARVLRNRAKNRKREATRRQRRECEAARPEGLPSAADVAVRFELSEQLALKVQQLPDPYREVLLFRYYEDLAPRAIAASLDIPVETVKTRLRRALDQLRQSLDRDHGSREKWLTALMPLTFPSIPSVGLSVAAGGTILMSMKTLAPLVLVPALGFVAWFVFVGSGTPDLEKSPQDPAPAQLASAPMPDAGTKEDGHDDKRQLVEKTKEPAADHTLFSGKVIASDGRPVKDAIVVALDEEQSIEKGSQEFLRKLDRWKRQFAKLKHASRKTQDPGLYAETNESGAYSLRPSKRAVQVLAWSDTHGLETMTISQWKACLGRIVMKNRCRIECRVTDEQDQPLADLWVDIYLTNPNRTFTYARTDAAGLCLSPPLEPGDYLIYASKNGYKAGRVLVRATGSRVSCAVRLERKAKSSFVLTDKDQIAWTATRIRTATRIQSSADIQVHLTRVRITYLEELGKLYYGENRLEYDGATGEVTGRLEDGSARYLSVWQGGLLVGETTLSGKPPDRIPLRIFFVHQEVLIEALIRNGSDPVAREPSKVELLKAYGPTPGPLSTTVTQKTSSGSAKFEIERQSLRAPTYLMATQGAKRSRIVKIPPIAKESRAIRVWLDLYPVIDGLHGRIIGANGRPIQGAQVVIVDRNGVRIVEANGFSLANTNAHGEFVVKKILAGKALLYVSAKGFAPSVHEIVIPETGDGLDPIRLYPGIPKNIHNANSGMVHVTILDASGRMIYSDRLMGRSRGGRRLGITVPPGRVQIRLYDVITGDRLPDPVKIGK